MPGRAGFPKSRFEGVAKPEGSVATGDGSSRSDQALASRATASPVRVQWHHPEQVDVDRPPLFDDRGDEQGFYVLLPFSSSVAILNQLIVHPSNGGAGVKGAAGTMLG